MQYEILYLNDDGSIKVRMTLDKDTLDQDFPATDDPKLLDQNVRDAMKIFKTEIVNKPQTNEPDISALVNQAFQVADDFSSSTPIVAPQPPAPEPAQQVN